MPAINHPMPSVRSLLVSWFHLTGRIFRACGAWLNPEWAADTIKDTMMAVRLPEEEPDSDSTPIEPLPPADPIRLLEESLNDLERVFHDAAAVINDDPGGCWRAAVEDQVQTLFQDLSKRVLERALEQRVTLAEAALGSAENGDEDWVKRYRRILAAEGRWPPGRCEDAPASQTGP